MKISPTPVVVTLVAIVCIGLAIMYNGQKMAEKANSPQPAAIKAIAPNVSVINAAPSTYERAICDR